MAAPFPIRIRCILLRQTAIAGLAGAAFSLSASAAPWQQPSVSALLPSSDARTPTNSPWLEAFPNTDLVRPEPPADPALPDAPSTTLAARTASVQQDQSGQDARQAPKLPPCPVSVPPVTEAQAAATTAPPLCKDENPLRSVVNSTQQHPLTSGQKGYLAVREVIDPFGLIVLTAQAGITIAANSHTAYGPGVKGFGSLTGYSLLGSATGAFLGTYAIPSLVHEDPRYRRRQNASIPRRFLHAVSRTVIAQHDDGRLMPNYATLLTYPISAEISNLYVPGVPGNGPDTARRIALGLATDPVGNLIAEFLPDIARHIHLRSVFFQQIVNQMIVADSNP